MVHFKRNSNDFLEAERAIEALNKRSRVSSIQENVYDLHPSQYNPLDEPSPRSIQENVYDFHPSQYDPLDEPSPLGLRLKKSPSFCDLIQTKLSQANGSSSASMATAAPKLSEEDVRDNTSSVLKEKLKASNFPALVLKIGDWEFVSRYDGDLVGKCYFAKNKLVWEILENGLKSKMEIQWSDITAIKASLPDEGPGVLYLTLDRPPHFFKEINPLPRKHTLWHACADFTNGKASIFRQHILQCPPGVLNKHYENLIEVDPHLYILVQQPYASNQSPYFDERFSFFKNPTMFPFHELDLFGTLRRSPVSALQDLSSSSSSFTSVGLTPEHVSLEAPSPSSGLDFFGSEASSSQVENGFQFHKNSQQLNALGIHKSMSMSDLVNQIGHCISERVTNPNSNEGAEGQDVLGDIADFLLSDTNMAPNSDENKLMSRVNSLCCLLQDPTTNAGSSSVPGNQLEGLADNRDKQPVDGMSRKDSFSDVLLSLPRIASLPKFLFDISEDDGDNLSK